MDNTIENFIRKQKVAFICSIDEEGFPNVKSYAEAEENGWVALFLFFYKHLINEGKTVHE